ncbi:PilC/PilY family type IV pilus protein [Rhodanobacter sp. DHG33]|uniref:pilus assembly protein n=1 Tax=Rhodanobacter sp. DHG33 TaxID=2775921 RepID=UPI00178411B9|nr:PilC/PilY family type IV pilus protein [Rhodanobacter sp. DHG33]MBD8898105.1 hypothetical protein [Rhodanobacter sp. DHG33]
MTHHRFLRERARAFTPTLLLTLAGGLGAAIPVQAVPTSTLPNVAALAAAPAASSTAPATASTAALAGEVQLSYTPPNQTQSVPPNIVMTFDDSGSMQSSRVNDQPPWTTNTSGSLLSGLPDWGNGTNDTSTTDGGGGPWRCAGVISPAATSGIGMHVMNGVYYNPNIIYNPPAKADGTIFSKADSTLTKVWVDGIAVNRPLSPVTPSTTANYNNNPDLDKPSAGALTDLTGTAQYTYPTITTYYATFGSTCAANADAGTCVTTASGTSGSGSSKIYVYYVNVITSTGSGTSTVYFGTGLKARNSSKSGYTMVSGDKTSVTNSPTKNFSTWSVTVTNTSATPILGADNRWQCGSGPATSGGGGDLWNAASPMDGQSHTLSDGTTITYPNGGPYYYRLKQGVTIAQDSAGNPTYTGNGNDGATTLYTASNWEAVPVTNTTVTINNVQVNQWQNFANWYAYYRTRNQMARTSISRVFGTGALATKITDPGNWDDGGFGSSIRLAWQNLDVSTYNLPSTSIISSLIDTSSCTATSTTASPSGIQQSGAITTPPNCYRSAFFNWIFQVPASGGTPTRSVVARAGKFFTRGNGNTTANAQGNLEDPYWQPPASGSGNGNELTCRQNYHMLVTDGLWNGDTVSSSTYDGPKYSTLTLATSGLTLPDGVTLPNPASAGVTSIYAPVHDASTSYASLSDIAFNYWATNLRPDLYTTAKSTGGYVVPYMPDQKVGVVSTTTLTGTTGVLATTGINQEIYFNPSNDPATWPHMSQYLVGLGVSGQLNFSADTDCTGTSPDTSDACMLRKGQTNSSGSIGWPTPNGNGQGIAANVDDTWHAALNGRGQFFSAGNPQDLINQLSNILTSITARSVPPATNTLNTSVLVPGALAFVTGYSSADWSGTMQAVQANTDGTVGTTPLWDAGALLTDASVTPPASRNILTAKENTDGSFGGGISFESTTTFDSSAQALLMLPAPTDTTNDTLANRINYLRGVRTEETGSVMRTRSTLLGAIIDSQAIYVGYPASGYSDNWPAGSPEATAITTAAAASDTGDDGSYEQFVQNHLTRKPVVYVGANDGMLHAFDASEAQNTDTPPKIVPTSTAGEEVFAYVPRSAYTNLGNLTSASFTFKPTVDGTPVTSDVFFDAATTTPATTSAGWHTILVGNLRNGGRGIYALDITDPTKVTEANAGSKVLWEFNSDTPAPSTGCYSNYGSCNPADLGFTYGQPNIGRLADGKWVVLVPGGYFPNCSKAPYNATNCPTPSGAPTAGSPAVAFSSLFVLNAQTGAMIAELKTPTNISGVTSYGLSSPVLGDYNNDQIDDIAFAGDLAGNLWRYDLTSASPSGWKITLAYKPTTQGAQPITVMPRLFPDPATGRFIVVYGTGKYLGPNDNTSTGVPTQALYGIRDLLDSNGNPVTVSGTSNLEQQVMSQATTSAYNTVRGMTNNAVSASQDGWYVNLNISSDPGERVVVTPGALFDTNRVIFTTLIPATNDPCTATITGAVMVLNAATGGSGGGIGSPAYTGWSIGTSTVGALVNNPPTGGTVPVATVVGGGSLLLPGLSLSGGGGTLTIPDAVWRRRSWGALDNEQ